MIQHNNEDKSIVGTTLIDYDQTVNLARKDRIVNNRHVDSLIDLVGASAAVEHKDFVQIIDDTAKLIKSQ